MFNKNNKNNNNNNNKKKEKKQEIMEFPKNLNTYLGNKGYTILKNELPIQLQTQLKEMLMVKPIIIGSPIQQIAYPVYRESDKKIYVPRYFGEEMFGKHKADKVSQGDNIDIAFNGTLRENQVPVVEKYLAHVLSLGDGGSGLLELPCGFGKTSIGLNIISRLKKKTLVIVHKTFLMNQWIERIQQFLPTAKIGKIQGQIIDIEGKDIVLCMLQSLSMKEYPTSLFDSFGFTIIDEVHHISSEVFSCALFKLVTKYMIGLSATMNRKDGTTKVFKMFLGEVLYKQERSKDEEVIVRGITYKIDDEEYNEVEMDFRGQTASAKMLSKICNYNRRSEFIIQVLKDMLKENEKQQIMIIASYKNILKYMYDAIQHHGIGTVGYYVGGMKEMALKESESKQIVLATYSMAAEGLDIKSLTTLFMITPMTSIEQSVGRILREKHAFSPVVVDIIDTHVNFQRQWAKRKAFYKKQNYKIIQSNSASYNPDVSTWNVSYTPTRSRVLTNDVSDGSDDDISGSDNDVLEDGGKESNDKSGSAGVCFL